MTPLEIPICYDCKHKGILSGDKPFCKAFINGIPDEIWLKGNKHKKPLKGQNNNIVFEKE